MRRFIKSAAAIFLVPLTKWYLRKERIYHFRNLTINVTPGVFHPGLFSSTKFIIRYLDGKDLKGKTFLELGCGTGLISIIAEKAGARVSASDISKSAVQNTRLNAERNRATIEIIHSDLFENISHRHFDWIIINPPYYDKEPKTEADFAWYCGEGFGYFLKLFSQLDQHINEHSKVLMVLTKGCDIGAITAIAREHGYDLDQVASKKVLFDEEDYLYEVRLPHLGNGKLE